MRGGASHRRGPSRLRWIVAFLAVSLLLPALAGADAGEEMPPVDVPPSGAADSEGAPAGSDGLEDSPVVLEEELQTAGPKLPTDWRPPVPSEDGWDWIRTTSGEWLKGSLTRMRDRVYEFDSDEFDDVEIDEEDVAFFRFSRPHSYRFRGQVVERGSGELRDGIIRVRLLEGGISEHPASELVSISRSAGLELDRWSADVGVGTTLRQGNTDQIEVTGTAQIERETAFTRQRLNYAGTYAEVESDRTTNNHRLQTFFDYFLTWRFFVTLPSFEFFTDEFQNIQARYTPGIGVGYELVENKRVEWDVTGALAYQRTEFESGTTAANDGAVILSTSLDLEVTKDLDWDTAYTVQLIVSDLGKTNHNLRSQLSFDVWGPIDFDFTFIFDRIEDPERESDGRKPDSNDYRLTAGLSIDF